MSTTISSHSPSPSPWHIWLDHVSMPCWNHRLLFASQQRDYAPLLPVSLALLLVLIATTQKSEIMNLQLEQATMNLKLWIALVRDIFTIYLFYSTCASQRRCRDDSFNVAHPTHISYHIVDWSIISHHTISYHIIPYHIIIYHIIFYHIIIYHIISYNIISYFIISYDMISYHIIS